MEIRDNQLVEAINDLIFRWQRKGLVQDARTHSVYRKSGGLKEITWGNDGFVLKDEEFSTFSEYCNLVENRQFSMLLNDGSFFQISYSLERSLIVKHRLCWYPCPISVDAAELMEREISDIILDRMQDVDLSSIRCRSPLRFDYAPLQAAENHAHVHLHLSEENCRIPVKSPLCLRQFMTFIVTHFFEILSKDKSLYLETETWDGLDTLTDKEKKSLHINIFKGL
ncbi:DUF2290 domain-containing protein [Yersinia ruckeri]|uniref:DUF2290 domain-containing protein n=1 Tax=Yersinia ruckeri TaxID=29486 RepID=UPI001F29C73C|nr:DUF2290 domain-containing protein [Yersinia ruckeri]EKN4706232.1 DUF2290 domain-containing protein [Yersinia ruckeri]UIN07015.1 DUF2290 domain-containing protein [Yersinia ruckeri]